MSYYEKRETEFIPDPSALAAGRDASGETKDLLLGVGIYSVDEILPIPDTYLTEQYNTGDKSGVLTDGVQNTDNVYTGADWFRCTRGGDRAITFRLPYLSAVSGFAVGFLRSDDVGIGLPCKLFISLSENGRDWELVCRDSRLTCIDVKGRCDREMKLDAPRKALYVRFKFDVPCHVWCDRLSAFGTTAIPSDAKDIVASPDEEALNQPIINKYPDYSQFLGVHNVLLSYNCLPKERAKDGGGLITEEQYLPHVAYIDKNGVMKDTFFDGFLYLPYTAFNYSGNAKTAEGWHYYVDNVFAQGRNLEALDRTVGSVKKKLGKPDYKVTAFFSILYTFTTATEFGDLDGSGRNLNFRNIEDRKYAIKWIIDEYVRRFNEKQCENTLLGGFYWFEENITYSDPHEFDLLAFARDYVHSLGHKFFWIPYYQATGFTDWQEAGFDIACMQPNYAFHKEIPMSRLYDNAEITKKLGMCVELESYDIKDPFGSNKFKQYLDVGAETGYMHSVKMYYQGGVPGDFYDAYMSDDPECRSVYDDLYLFAKEKYVSRKDR